MLEEDGVGSNSDALLVSRLKFFLLFAIAVADDGDRTRQTRSVTVTMSRYKKHRNWVAFFSTHFYGHALLSPCVEHSFHVGAYSESKIKMQLQLEYPPSFKGRLRMGRCSLPGLIQRREATQCFIKFAI